MECPEFLSRFSEYRDGLLGAPDRSEAERHLRRCQACRRYERVVRRGVDLLRALPPPGLPDDFRPRLRHRLLREGSPRGEARPDA